MVDCVRVIRQTTKSCSVLRSCDENQFIDKLSFDGKVENLSPILSSDPMRWALVEHGNPSAQFLHPTDIFYDINDNLRLADELFPNCHHFYSSGCVNYASNEFVQSPITFVETRPVGQNLTNIMLPIVRYFHQCRCNDLMKYGEAEYRTLKNDMSRTSLREKVLILCCNVTAVFNAFDELRQVFPHWNIMLTYDPINGPIMHHQSLHARNALVPLVQFDASTHIDVLITTQYNSGMLIEYGVFGFIVIDTTSSVNSHNDRNIVEQAALAVRHLRCDRVAVLGSDLSLMSSFEHNPVVRCSKIDINPYLREHHVYKKAGMISDEKPNNELVNKKMEEFHDEYQLFCQVSELHSSPSEMFRSTRLKYLIMARVEAVIEQKVQFLINKYRNNLSRLPSIAVVTCTPEHTRLLMGRLQMLMKRNDTAIFNCVFNIGETTSAVNHPFQLMRLSFDESIIFGQSPIGGRIIIGTRKEWIGFSKSISSVAHVIDSTFSFVPTYDRSGLCIPVHSNREVEFLLAQRNADCLLPNYKSNDAALSCCLQEISNFKKPVPPATLMDYMAHVLNLYNMNSLLDEYATHVIPSYEELHEECHASGFVVKCGATNMLTPIGQFCQLLFPYMHPESVCLLVLCSQLGLLVPGLITAASDCTEWKFLTTTSLAAHDETRKQQPYSTLDMYRINRVNSPSDSVCATNMIAEFLSITSWKGFARANDADISISPSNAHRPNSSDSSAGNNFWERMTSLRAKERQLMAHNTTRSQVNRRYIHDVHEDVSTHKLTKKYTIPEERLPLEATMEKLLLTLINADVIPYEILKKSMKYHNGSDDRITLEITADLSHPSLNSYTHKLNGQLDSYTMSSNGEVLFRALRTMTSSRFAMWDDDAQCYVVTIRNKLDSSLTTKYKITPDSQMLKDTLRYQFVRYNHSAYLHHSVAAPTEFSTIIDPMTVLQLAAFGNLFGNHKTWIDNAHGKRYVSIECNGSSPKPNEIIFQFEQDDNNYPVVIELRNKFKNILSNLISTRLKNRVRDVPDIHNCSVIAEHVIDAWNNLDLKHPLSVFYRK